MESLSINKSNSIITNNLIRIGDLLYFDGPLLTLFEDTNNGHLYLFDWVDRDNISNRWLVYRVSPLALLDFITRQISHFELYKSNPDFKFYVVDIQTKHTITDYTLSELNEVPMAYLPNKENYFDELDSLHITKIREVTIKVLSRKKQNNEYFMQIAMQSSIRKEGFNKIDPSRYKIFHNNLGFVVEMPNELGFQNQYNQMKTSNVNLISKAKKTNKMYA